MSQLPPRPPWNYIIDWLTINYWHQKQENELFWEMQVFVVIAAHLYNEQLIKKGFDLCEFSWKLNSWQQLLLTFGIFWQIIDYLANYWLINQQKQIID